MSSVYFLRAGDDGPVKIGFASDLNLRITEIQIGCPEPLSILRVIDDGGKTAERWLHKHFKDKRLRGEWFSFTDEMLTIEVPKEVLDVDGSIKAACKAATIDLDAIINLQKSSIENPTVNCWITYLPDYIVRQRQCCLAWAERCVARAKPYLADAKSETNLTIALAIADRGDEFIKLSRHWRSKFDEIRSGSHLAKEGGPGTQKVVAEPALIAARMRNGA